MDTGPGSTGAPLEGGNLRASDRDRERVAQELRTHCLDGRITVEELERRIEAAMAARTIHELAELVSDLPSIPGPEPPARRSADPSSGPPGVRPFTRRILVPASLRKTRSVALQTIAPALNAYGFELARQSPAGLEFERSSLPNGAVLAAILLFPFGLIALFSRRRERIVVAFEPHGSGQTVMLVHGRASRRVRKAFARLRFDEH